MTLRHFNIKTAALAVSLLWILCSSGCGGSAPAPDGAAGDPASVAAGEAPWFEEVSAERGIDFVHRSGFDGTRHLMPESVSGGGAFLDYDGDGDMDVYLVQSGSLTDSAKRRPGNELYENLGDGTFRKLPEGNGAADDGYGLGVACADYDNDGDVDIYVSNYGPNALLRNNGDGSFTNVTEEAGVGDPGYGSSTGFLDYDRDGDLDLFVANYINWSLETELECYNQMGGPDYCSPMNYTSPAMDVLYRNEGDGTFTEVTEQAGVDRGFGNGLGVVAGDFNGDGWLDLFVANDALADQLWINRQDGSFSDEALLAGCAVDLEGGVPKAGMGVAAGDLDDDGDLELMVCNLVDEADSVYRNDGEYFTDITSRAGLGVVSRRFTRFGVGWIDFDNDGYLDQYQANGRVRRAAETFSEDGFAEPNLLFRGGPGPRFEEVQPRGGTRELLATTSRAAAFGDFDDDGGMDILVVSRDHQAFLLRNIVPQRGRWIRFRVLDEHGRDAEGAIVRLRLPDRTLRRDVRAHFSYLASNDPRVHVGLGDNSAVESVEVTWVDGYQRTFGPFEADQTVTLRREKTP